MLILWKKLSPFHVSLVFIISILFQNQTLEKKKSLFYFSPRLGTLIFFCTRENIPHNESEVEHSEHLSALSAPNDFPPQWVDLIFHVPNNNNNNTAVHTPPAIVWVFLRPAERGNSGLPSEQLTPLPLAQQHCGSWAADASPARSA